MEIPTLRRAFQEETQRQQDYKRYVATDVGQNTRAVRIMPPDDQVPRPVIGSEKKTEESGNGKHPFFALMADPADQAQQQRSHTRKQLENILGIIQGDLSVSFRFAYVSRTASELFGL